MNRLAGKTAIVTGGAVGIGRACVIRMAEEGANVAILDLLEAEGAAVFGEMGDRTGLVTGRIARVKADELLQKR